MRIELRDEHSTVVETIDTEDKVFAPGTVRKVQGKEWVVQEGFSTCEEGGKTIAVQTVKVPEAKPEANDNSFGRDGGGENLSNTRSSR